MRVAAGRALFRASSPVEPFSIIELNLATHETNVLRRASNVEIDPGYFSEPTAD